MYSDTSHDARSRQDEKNCPRDLVEQSRIWTSHPHLRNDIQDAEYRNDEARDREKGDSIYESRHPVLMAPRNDECNDVRDEQHRYQEQQRHLDIHFGDCHLQLGEGHQSYPKPPRPNMLS